MVRNVHLGGFMTEDMGEYTEVETSTRVNNAPGLVKALQTAGALTLQQEAQLQVAFSRAGDTSPEQTFLETGIFTPKQCAGLAKTLQLLDAERMSIMDVSTCLSSMLGTFATLDEALREIELTAGG